MDTELERAFLENVRWAVEQATEYSERSLAAEEAGTGQFEDTFVVVKDYETAEVIWLTEHDYYYRWVLWLEEEDVLWNFCEGFYPESILGGMLA